MFKVLATVGIALFVGLVLGAMPASAHAALVSTDPSDGARLKTAPTKVTLKFNEGIASPAFLVITAPDGSPVKTSAVEAIDKTVTATVASVDMKGIYSMSFRVVSADGHPIDGTTTFDVAAGRTVEQLKPAKLEPFTSRHQGQLLWGSAGAVIAIGLLLWPLRGRSD